MKILDKLANLFAAVAFAEEGEAETARRLMAEGDDAEATGRARTAPHAPRPAPRPDVPVPGRSRA